jgi:hypothetical protein
MADVVSAVSSVVGLATAAIQLTKTIRDVIDAVKSAPTRLRQLSDELHILGTILTEVGDIVGFEKHGEQGSMKLALKSCQEELSNLENTIKHYHTGEGANAYKRVVKGVAMFFDDKEIGEAIQRLQRHENRVGLSLLSNITMFDFTSGVR